MWSTNCSINRNPCWRKISSRMQFTSISFHLQPWSDAARPCHLLLPRHLTTHARKMRRMGEKSPSVRSVIRCLRPRPCSHKHHSTLHEHHRLVLLASPLPSFPSTPSPFSSSLLFSRSQCHPRDTRSLHTPTPAAPQLVFSSASIFFIQTQRTVYCRLSVISHCSLQNIDASYYVKQG